jgi:hypothetical protein
LIVADEIHRAKNGNIAYHDPTLGMETHGSCGGLLPPS